MDFSRDFIAFACERRVLSFGEFKPRREGCRLFLQCRRIDDGAALANCATSMRAPSSPPASRSTCSSGRPTRHPLVAGTAMALAQLGRNVPFCFNRKEAKDHGEGGTLIGAPPAGRVLIIDDVISAAPRCANRSN